MQNKLAKIETTQLPEEVLFILSELDSAGYKSYLVGGAVRDLLLCLDVSDYDITTSANPREVKAVFPDYTVIDTGIEHGTVTILVDNQAFEITSFRTDGLYLDHRRPESVQLSRSLEEDTQRRDFTINQIAYSPTEGLVDYHGGLKDLQAGIIRTVGDPEKRFGEDALRILRCFRFSSTYGFTIEAETFTAASENISDLDYISGERIRIELEKLLLGQHLEEMWSTYLGLWSYLFPNVSREYFENFNAEAFELLGKSFIPRLLLVSTGKDASKLATRLKLSRIEKDYLLNYSQLMGVDIKRIGTDAVDLIRFAFENHIEVTDFLNISTAFALAQKQDITKYEEASVNIGLALAEDVPLRPSELLISGKDLIDAGFEQGPLIGAMLKELWIRVLEAELDNDREALIASAEADFR